MRPTTPNLKIPRSVGPSSPPQTPTAASPVLGPQHSLKTGAMAPHNHVFPMAPGFTARFAGKGPTFGHARPARPDQLSPRSSNTSLPSSSDEDEARPSPSRSLSPEHTDPAAPAPPPPPRNRPERTVVNSALIIEEMSDFTDSDDDRFGVIRPVAIEDAESDRSRSRSRYPPEIYQRITSDLGNLHCSDSDYSDLSEAEHQEFLKRQREAKRRKRMSSGSIGKRTISESIGSDTDREDMNKPFLPVEEVGSTARRLRRRMGNRHSMQFRDPRPIQELDEPESSEDEYLISEALARELPYYEYSVMEIDSPSP
ncbi:hypothetical protein QBC47DRAFT_362904 [Echria macrotheca]|uniref:Uncharacterized protein n=1 Tax=Echria macrotheca TaxID=438768 RepID=A0AAJ0F767_9PEZI|nr:hypothetical protein QBC47DRAFT_362904 [Echria macrotheca]